jgi:16S rRNA (adenine1518-N6/adenine1519-N6)-dimethyltransferase
MGQKLGQHFLQDGGWRTRIAEQLKLAPGQNWVEIGPGHGELTKLIAGDGRCVVAVEADRKLASEMESAIAARPAEWPGVSVVTGDVLETDISEAVSRLTGDGDRGKFHVYGSLPYYITSPILQHLFRWAERIESIHIVIQLEVAERIAAAPGGREYGYLSSLCQYFAKPRIAFKIPPGAFHPPPKVWSTMVELTMPGESAALGIAQPEKFFGFLRVSFAQKRKTLRNNLLGTSSDDRIHKALEAAGVRSDARAEQLTLKQFATIFNTISS